MTIEAFLAKIYVDEDARRRFMTNPFEEAMRSGFDETTSRGLAAMNFADLELAARSFAGKRKRVAGG